MLKTCYIKKYLIVAFSVIAILCSFFYIYQYTYDQYLMDDINNYNRFFWNEHYNSTNKIKSTYKVVIIGPETTSNGRVVSDETLILRIVRAARKMGWQIFFYDNILGKEDEIIRFNPDFIITTIPKWNMSSYKPLPYKIYSFIPLQRSSFFFQKNNFSLKKIFHYNGLYQHIFTISDGLILTDKSFLLFKELFQQKSKNKFHGIVGYPGVDYFPYDKHVNAKKIIYYGINWDLLRSSKQYLELYDMLAKRKIIDFYGPFIGWINNYRDGWKGFLSLRGKKNNDGQLIIDDNDVVLDKIKEYGIVLILHSLMHLQEGLPSLREFEAAASSSLIISDEHEFVKNIFGDSALYITVKNKTSEEIYSQILSHYKWIINNPDKVKIMTKKAHEIYMINFTLEKLLNDIAHMHESVLRNENVDDSQNTKRMRILTHVRSKHVALPSLNAPY